MCCGAWAVCGVVPVHAAAGRRPKARRHGAACQRGAGVRAHRRRRQARAVRGSVACSARRGRPHRSVEQKPAMPGPRLSRAAWQHGLPDRHHHTQPRSDDGMHHRVNVFIIRGRPSHHAIASSIAAHFVISDQWQCYRNLASQWGSVNAEVSSRFDRPQTERSRHEWSPRATLDGAGGRSCGEHSPPAPRCRRRRLLFRAVHVHKIIIGRPVVNTAARRRAVADVSGARARALAESPASPTFRHRRLQLARHTTLTRQVLH